MPVEGRGLVGWKNAYLKRRNHEGPVASAAPPSSERVEPLRAVDLGASAPGASLYLVRHLIGGVFRLRVCRHSRLTALFLPAPKEAA